MTALRVHDSFDKRGMYVTHTLY